MSALDINLMPWHAQRQRRRVCQRHWLHWGIVCALWGVATGQLARMAWHHHSAMHRLEEAAAQLQAQADIVRYSDARWVDMRVRRQTLQARQQRLDQHDALIRMLQAIRYPHTVVMALEGTAESGRAMLQSDQQEALQALLPSLEAAGALAEPLRCAAIAEETPTCTLTLFWPWLRSERTEVFSQKRSSQEEQ